ncbi:hypothetical protein QTH91_05850 [Variovorax dokdonensis]|uniref:Uncharacterized protein n=1 Tax=Variovorax dokdonensis TaxID=344883 RepID=A0ABT7N7V4_9BURK|nr:hypothetical protein [Variovorax dokdonensis]MDM0043997.1 hypothetical protein [Variovorax dokdonensis]
MAVIDLITSAKNRTIVLDAPGSLTPAFIKVNTEAIQAILRVESVKQLDAQLKLGNEVNFINVDNSRSKGILFAEKFVQVRFGSTIPVKVLRVTEQALMKAVRSMTQPRTGALRDLSNWNWMLLRKGKQEPLINKPGQGIVFGPGDRLILKPTLNYASIAANSKGTPTYFLVAARALKRHPLFSSLNVSVQSTKAHQVPGEKSNQGTKFLQITPKQGRLSRSRRR